MAWLLAPSACGSNQSASNVGTVQDPQLDDSLYLDELTSDESSALCAYLQALRGGPGTLTCSDGSTVDVDTVAKCVDTLAALHCLVGDVTNCVETASDACEEADTSACDAYLSCVAESTASG